MMIIGNTNNRVCPRNYLPSAMSVSLVLSNEKMMLMAMISPIVIKETNVGILNISTKTILSPTNRSMAAKPVERYINR